MDWHELRHWCATHLVTSLGLSFPDAAEQLGHTDGGALLARLYFHADKERALDTIARAFARAAEQLRVSTRHVCTASERTDGNR